MTALRSVIAALSAGIIALVVLAMGVTAASAAVPGKPTPCSAEKVAGGFLIKWTRPTSSSPVWRYIVRVKGQSKPVERTSVKRGKENPDRQMTWTNTIAGAKDPLTFLVRAFNSDGVGQWCEAPVEEPATEPTTPEPTTPEPTEEPTEPEPTQEPTTPPATDSALASKVGIRVFPHYAGKTYSNHDAVLGLLGELGVKRVSALLYPTMSGEELRFYQEAHSRYGIKVWFAVGAPDRPLTADQWSGIRDLLSGPLKGMVEVASGWNEPNHRVTGDWSTRTATHQKELWANIQRVNSATGQSIKVGTPPLWSGNFDKQFSDLKLLAPKIQGAYNYINWHMYPHGQSGAKLEALVERQVREFRAAYGNFPMLNSESGYFTAENYSGGSNPSTEQEQAQQIDDLILFHTKRDIAISIFETLDDPDPTGANREAHFGLVRTPAIDPGTWSKKPAFGVVRGLLAS